MSDIKMPQGDWKAKMIKVMQDFVDQTQKRFESSAELHAQTVKAVQTLGEWVAALEDRIEEIETRLNCKRCHGKGFVLHDDGHNCVDEVKCNHE